MKEHFRFLKLNDIPERKERFSMHLKQWLPTAAMTLVLDRALKLLAAANPAERPLIPGVLRWIYAENTGIAFSLLSGHPFVLGLIAAAVCIAGAVLLWHFCGCMSAWSRVAAGMMLGGALGNAVDRLLLGYVVDMLDITLFRFAVFNLADAALVVGAVILIFRLLISGEDWRLDHD